MANVATYRFIIKSQEQRGSSYVNSVTVGLESDEDAATFKANLALLVKGTVVSVDKVVPATQDYSLPYPADTGYQLRMAQWCANGQEFQLRLRNLKTDCDVVTALGGLAASGILGPSAAFPATTTINGYVIKPPATLLAE